MLLVAVAIAAASCPPGSFGDSCGYNITTLFNDHDPYASPGDLPNQSRLDGWSPPCDFYASLVRKYAVGFIVEVGVWKGKSAACLAGALRTAQRGALIAVDTWLGALEFWTRMRDRKKDPSRDLYFHHGYPQVYPHFLANVVREKLQKYVIPFPVPSRLTHDFIAELKGARPDLMHIDAAHEYDDATEDIRMWWALLRPGGVLLGDDFQPVWQGVVRAACEHAQKYGLQIFRPSQRGYVQKKWWVLKPEEGAVPRSPHNSSWLAACTMQTPDGWVPNDAGVLTVVAGGPHSRRRPGRLLLEMGRGGQGWVPRGANYVPSYAKNSIGIWHDYDASVVDRELGFASSLLGFTSVRVFLNSLAYANDAPRFLANYEHLLASCERHGLTAFVVLFDRDFPDCEDVPFPGGPPGCSDPDRAFVTSGAYRNSSWCPNPGAAAVADTSRWPALEAYVDAVVGGQYAADERIAAFELMNEPREADASAFLAHFAARIAQSTSRPLAIEPAYAPAPRAATAAASILSYHTYNCDGKCMNATYTQLARDAAQQNKTAVNSELGGRPHQPYCDAITGVLAAGVGYFAWELMLGVDQFHNPPHHPNFQGLVWPNGSAFDPVEAACIKAANVNARLR